MIYLQNVVLAREKRHRLIFSLPRRLFACGDARSRGEPVFGCVFSVQFLRCRCMPQHIVSVLSRCADRRVPECETRCRSRSFPVSALLFAYFASFRRDASISTGTSRRPRFTSTVTVRISSEIDWTTPV